MFVKILNGNASPFTDYHYSLPKNGRPGRWTPNVEPLLGQTGYHLTTPERVFDWFHYGDRVFTAEYRGKVDAGASKIACESIRLVEEITPEWRFLPLYPVLMAWLVSQWRRKNGTTHLPDWVRLRYVDLSRARLQYATLPRIDLTGAYLTNADLSGADLTGAYLTNADLSGADLTHADLTGALLFGADLTNADLSGADLTGANLTGALLFGADLTHADLSGADLTGAYLTNADLTGAQSVDLPAGWEIGDDGLCRRIEED